MVAQTRSLTTQERAQVREQIGLYYAKKLATLQQKLFEALEKLDNPFEIDRYIHCYHKQSQELYVRMEYRSQSNTSLPAWLREMDEDERGIRVWQPGTRLPHEEEQCDDDEEAE